MNIDIRCWFLILACAASLACTPSGNDEPIDTGYATEVGETTAAAEDTTGDATGDATGDTTGDTTGHEPDLPPGMEEPLDPNEQLPPPDEDGCHGIYAQDLLPTFELEIAPVVWEELMYEWNNGLDLKNEGVNPNPHHPLEEFRYGDIKIHNAEIRLRGNPENWDPVPGNKMQFQIGFHRNDPDGRFLGLSRVLFDAATKNRHMLRDRLSLWVMRDAGIIAPCANNARVVVNGEYYGLFTSIEKVDQVFLTSRFDDPTGDLWKRANWTLRTNLDSSNTDRLDALIDAESPEELDAYFNIAQALWVYAAQAVLPDSDGFWAGGLNGYYYDDPLTEKFMPIPWDLDNGLDRFGGEYPLNPDPIVWEKPTSHGRPFYDLSIEPDEGFALYIDIIDEIMHESYTPDELHALIDTWTAQIEESVIEDTNKPFGNDLYYEKLDELYEYVEQRYEFLEEWMECWEDGGEPDKKGYCEEP